MIQKKVRTFATAIETDTTRCVSSAWLECLPVTQEVTGSSPVRTAENNKGFEASLQNLFYVTYYTPLSMIRLFPNNHMVTKSAICLSF